MLRRSRNGANDRAPAEIAPSSHLIDLRAVVKDYVTPAGSFRALRGVDLQVDAGEFIAVVGKSGSGKSTLMNMMAGIDRATAGDVWVGATHLNHLTEGRTAEWRGRMVGVIFQFFQLLPTLTVVENVMLPMDFAGFWTPKQREERAMALLEQVELADQARKLPSATSGGQQQRAAIARALANDPPILLADEPTGNLDSATAEAVIRLFDELVGAGKTIVMVTHDREIAVHARRTVHMVDGSLLDGVLPDDGATETPADGGAAAVPAEAPAHPADNGAAGPAADGDVTEPPAEATAPPGGDGAAGPAADVGAAGPAADVGVTAPPADVGVTAPPRGAPLTPDPVPLGQSARA